MHLLLQQRGLRLVMAANLISMVGSGMNMAAAIWFILQETGSERALGTLVVLQTIPALLMMPFTGVVIDRQDRRHLVMLLDGFRFAVVLVVAVIAWYGQAQVWHIYLMAILLASAFWMFWPTLTALVQELTPESEFVHANTFMLAGVQGGWLVAGAIVGFVYNHVGLAGVLLLDCLTYLVSFLCYFLVRKGRQVVQRPAPPEWLQHEGPLAHWWHELREGLRYLHHRRYLILLGSSWALFLAAMLAQGVITAPLSDRILRAGSVGYGWLNAGWAAGAFLSAVYAPAAIRRWGARRAEGLSMALLALCLFVVPFSPGLAVAVLLFALMGSARGVGGVSISTSLMEAVPKHFMGRVQNIFFFAGTALQLGLGYSVGVTAERWSLPAAFAVIGLVYVTACLAAVWPVARPVELPQVVEGEAVAREAS